ncbi:MAG TPA: hypothetical protein VE954_06060 [Oligoflexus sp.]|uniref:hypothetical protein n=1 Tax=Oligoflexus sp. TaxID=1971216 RepID=UPI002D47E6C9|nr:hypothetical protein [Oligoflexus sp.]HYX32658.1 hypothetical protein [Oligoflexus sp.]
MVNENALLDDLIQAIEAWLGGNKNRSLSSLSRRSRIAYSTIRRIVQNKSAPHPFTALAIVEVILTVPERVEFLRKHFPTLGELIDECSQPQLPELPIEESFQRYITLEPHNRIFNMAATLAGTNRPTIQRIAGEIGLEALEEMINAGLLAEDGQGGIRYHQRDWVFPSSDHALEQVKLSVEHFNKPLLGTSGASIMHATGAVRADVVPQLKALIMKFIEEFLALKNAKESEGTIPFFCDLVYSLYDQKDWDADLDHLRENAKRHNR